VVAWKESLSGEKDEREKRGRGGEVTEKELHREEGTTDEDGE